MRQQTENATARPMNARTRERSKWRRELSAYWQQNPITTCEVRFKGCWGTYGLAPAHSRKRRKIESKDQYFEVVAACLYCHRKLDEQMSQDEMEATVKQIIANRITEEI
jgi:hypothetical protein